MLLEGNLTTGNDGPLDGDASRSMIDAKDYADFLQYVNSFNWTGVADVVGAIDDPFTNFIGGLDGSSAIGLDPSSFWLNFSGHSSTVSDSSFSLNASAVDTAVNSSTADWIWEAGKLRIPLYRSVFSYLLIDTGRMMAINKLKETVTSQLWLSSLPALVIWYSRAEGYVLIALANWFSASSSFFLWVTCQQTYRPIRC